MGTERCPIGPQRRTLGQAIGRPVEGWEGRVPRTQAARARPSHDRPGPVRGACQAPSRNRGELMVAPAVGLFEDGARARGVKGLRSASRTATPVLSPVEGPPLTPLRRAQRPHSRPTAGKLPPGISPRGIDRYMSSRTSSGCRARRPARHLVRAAIGGDAHHRRAAHHLGANGRSTAWPRTGARPTRQRGARQTLGSRCCALAQQDPPPCVASPTPRGTHSSSHHTRP